MADFKININISCLVLILFLAIAHGYQPLRCTVCRAARHLTQCDETVNCDATTDVCFVEKVVNSVGVIHINAGCKNKTDCDSQGCYGEGQSDAQLVPRARRADPGAVTGNQSTHQGGAQGGVLCHHCCDGDFCNMFGCHDTFDLEALEGQRCFSCVLTKELEHCKTTVNCEKDEVCYIQKLAMGQERWYSSGCVKDGMCSLLSALHVVHGARRKRQAVPLWSDCCRHHMCNGHSAVDRAPPSRNSTNYTCPMLQAPAIVTSNPDFTPAHGGMKCQACHHANSPDDCIEVEYCTDDEICFMEMDASRNSKVFTLGCKKKAPVPGDDLSLLFQTRSTLIRQLPRSCLIRMCDILRQAKLQQQSSRKKRSYTTLWSDCCDTELCNKHLGQELFVGTTEAGTTAAPPTTEAPPSCRDTFSFCSHYDVEYICEGANEDWARVNCREYCGYCTGTQPQARHLVSTTTRTTSTTSTTPSMTPSTTKSTTAAAPLCQDTYHSCDIYDAIYICEGDSEAWARSNCQKYCGYCKDLQTTTTMMTTTTPSMKENECKNKYGHICSLYPRDYICEGANEAWAKDNCVEYCGLCDSHRRSETHIESTTPKKAECKNKYEPNCTLYPREYICTGANEAWAKDNCAEYCGLCDTMRDPATSAATRQDCRDVDQDCASYGRDYICTPKFESWSKLHCAKFCGLCDDHNGTTTSTSTSSSPVGTAVKSSVVIPLCHDVDDDCDTYGRDYICTPMFSAWAKIHCAKYCGFCGATTTPIPPTTIPTTVAASSQHVCKDLDTDCDTYGRHYVCTPEFRPWAILHCAKYCGLCGVTAATTTTTLASSTTPMTRTSPAMTSQVTAHGCVDMDTDCDTYGRQYICAPDYVPWAKLHCAKYCGLCGDSTSMPSTTSTTTPTTTSSKLITSTSCVDMDSDCDTYGRQYICVPDYVPWAKLHCAKYCGLCGAATNLAMSTASLPTTTSTPAATAQKTTMNSATNHTCVDVDLDCHTYGRQYICALDYRPWAKLHCAKYCGLCGDDHSSVYTTDDSTTTTTTATSTATAMAATQITNRACVDVDTDCGTYGKEYICAPDYVPWAKLHCAKYCNLC